MTTSRKFAAGRIAAAMPIPWEPMLPARGTVAARPSLCLPVSWTKIVCSFIGSLWWFLVALMGMLQATVSWLSLEVVLSRMVTFCDCDNLWHFFAELWWIVIVCDGLILTYFRAVKSWRMPTTSSRSWLTVTPARVCCSTDRLWLI